MTELTPEIVARLTRTARQLEPMARLWEETTLLTDRQREAVDELTRRLADNYPYGDVRYIGRFSSLLTRSLGSLRGSCADQSEQSRTRCRSSDLSDGEGSCRGHRRDVWDAAAPRSPHILGDHRQPRGAIRCSRTSAGHSRCVQSGSPLHARADEPPAGNDARDHPAGSPWRGGSHALEARLEGGGRSLVATLGSTSLGALDPVDEIVTLARRYEARVHVDTAYGGFHTLLATTNPSVDPRPFHALPHVDSIVVDHTSTGSNRMGVARSCSRTPRWAASSLTTPHTPISLRASCTWVRSASSAHAPAQPLRPCGQPCALSVLTETGWAKSS